MAVKVCKALSAAISLCCGEPRTCQCRRVRLRLRRAACEAHTLPPIELQSLISPSSGEILAECPPFICSPRQSSSPNDPHFSIFYTPEMGTAPIPLFLFVSHSFSSLRLCVFTVLHSDAKCALSCWLPQIFGGLQTFFFLIPRELEDQPGRLRLVVWKKKEKKIKQPHKDAA